MDFTTKELIKKSIFNTYVDDMNENVNLYQITIDKECFKSKKTVLKLMDNLRRYYNEFYSVIDFKYVQPIKREGLNYYRIDDYFCERRCIDSDIVIFEDVEVRESKEYDSYGGICDMEFQETKYYIASKRNKIELENIIFTPYGLFIKKHYNDVFKDDYYENENIDFLW